MFGDSIDVTIKVDGKKIVVTPNKDYVADIPYTLVIAPISESKQSVKLKQGTHLLLNKQKKQSPFHDLLMDRRLLFEMGKNPFRKRYS